MLTIPGLALQFEIKCQIDSPHSVFNSHLLNCLFCLRYNQNAKLFIILIDHIILLLRSRRIYLFRPRVSKLVNPDPPLNMRVTEPGVTYAVWGHTHKIGTATGAFLKLDSGQGG